MSSSSLSVPEKPARRHLNALFSGMALFSMFFGAGNLIFPLIIGKSAGTETFSALLGLSFSAVLFPFLGLIAITMYGGNLTAFFQRLGKTPAFLLLLVLNMAQGPMGSMPRLLTLMHATTKAYIPSLSLPWFSLILAAIIFLLTFRPHRIVSFLGVILTPLLLLSLTILILSGVMGDPPSPHVVNQGFLHFFGEGLKGGYQTMDLLAAILFATVIMPHLARGTDTLPASQRAAAVQSQMKLASIIAAGLLMVVYIGLCWLSSHYSNTLDPATAPEDLLSAISIRLLGPWGGLISAAAVFLACLTTAISLAAVFANFFKKEICKDKISSTTSLLITLLLTASMANLGFAGLMKLWGPALNVLYPLLIVLCVLNILKKRRQQLTV